MLGALFWSLRAKPLLSREYGQHWEAPGPFDRKKLMNEHANRPAKIRINRPRRCAVCRHPGLARIELPRARRCELGSKFGLHRDAVWRHWRDHTSPERKAQLLAGPVQLHELDAFFLIIVPSDWNPR